MKLMHGKIIGKKNVKTCRLRIVKYRYSVSTFSYDHAFLLLDNSAAFQKLYAFIYVQFSRFKTSIALFNISFIYMYSIMIATEVSDVVIITICEGVKM